MNKKLAKKIVSGLIAICMMITFVQIDFRVAHATNASTIISGQYYYILSKSSGKYLEVTDSNNSSLVKQDSIVDPNNPNNYQKWRIDISGSNYRFYNLGSSKYMDITPRTYVNGNSVCQYAGTSTIQWSITNIDGTWSKITPSATAGLGFSLTQTTDASYPFKINTSITDNTQRFKFISTNSTLSNLTTSQGAVSGFNSATTTYSMTVPNAVSSISVTPTLSDVVRSTMTVNGVAVNSGSPSAYINLVGETDIYIVVTAEDTSTTQYTLKVTRALSADDNLSNLLISSGTLSPDFSSDNTDYTANVSTDVSSITLTPTVEDPKASVSSVTVNGNPVDCSAAIEDIPLDYGDNTIQIDVVADNGDDQVYTVTVTRAMSSNADLSNLTLSSGTLSPAFDAQTTDYSVSVLSGTDNITLSPTVSDTGFATVTVNGTAVTSGSPSSAIDLTIGENDIPVVVTAQDGTTKTYTVKVTRAGYVLVTDVSLDQSTLSMFTADSATLTATITPSNASNQGIVWMSSNISVATVDQSGNITAVGIGTANITVTTNDGGKTAACSVTVNSPSFTVIKDGTNLIVNIKGCKANYNYQIWTYQKVTSDTILNTATNLQANQWILSQEYTLGSAGTLESDGSRSFTIADFVSPDENRTVNVRIADSNLNYLGVIKYAFTPLEVQQVKISQVYVDGTFSDGNETKEIKADTPINIKVLANIQTDVTYTATIKENNTIINPSGSDNNIFAMNTTSLTPGKYTVVLVATNGTTSDTRTINFTLYSLDSSINYGQMTDMTVTGAKDLGNFNITINPTIATPNSNILFYYQIGEPFRTPFIQSTMLSPVPSYSQSITNNNYGVFIVFGYVKRNDGTTFDDGIMKYITNKRSDTIPSTLNIAATANGVATDFSSSIVKSTPIVFTSTASIGGMSANDPVQYSYWRYDATGWVLVKDWSLDNTLDWTPARPGVYTIQARAKGLDASSYEVSNSVNVTVASDEIAQVQNISINQAELNNNATARVPIIIKASATATSGTDLLYKFYVSDDFLGVSCLQDYSAVQDCTWVPRKAGTYQILVLVKNKDSFGRFDAISSSFEVTVK